jgi:hypothetical protein
MDMVERVAKAIATKALGEVGRDYDPFAVQKCIPYARAAIEAMREPTEEMFKAGDLHDTYDFTVAWRPMIDAALEETKPTTKGEVA